jgi:hypothetical protein
VDSRWKEVLVCVVEFYCLEYVGDHDGNVLEDGVFVVVLESSQEFVLASGVASF